MLKKLKITDKHYKADEPCKQGHEPYRYKASGECIYCHYIKVHKWRDANPTHMPIRNKAYYKNNLEYEKARRDARAKNFPEERLAINRNRRARKKKAEGTHSRADVLTLFKKQKGRCVGINCKFDLTKGYHVDHVMPLVKGGSNWPDNLQLLCRPCNDSKGIKTMDEWRLVCK